MKVTILTACTKNNCLKKDTDMAQYQTDCDKKDRDAANDGIMTISELMPSMP
jgi:hypothetical protein